MQIRSFTAAVPNYSDEIRQIASIQPIYFRTKSFGLKIIECEKILLETVSCQNGKAILLTASGTGAMDAAVSNLIDEKDQILVINGGTWGKRWIDICEFYNLNYDIFPVDFGRNINLEKLEEQLNLKRYSVVLCQHNETSSMQLYPVKKIGKLSEKFGFKFIVDAISSFMIDTYQMSEWNVYATVLSMNKGVGVYPGISSVILSEKAELKSSKSFYFDFKKYLDKVNPEFLLPFTPAIVSLNQLFNRLQYVNEIGVDKIISKIQKRADQFRSELIHRNLPFTLLAETPSNCGSVLLTDRRDVKTFFYDLQKKDIYFTPSGGEEGGKFIISHIGDQKENHIIELIEELEKWVKRKK